MIGLFKSVLGRLVVCLSVRRYATLSFLLHVTVLIGEAIFIFAFQMLQHIFIACKLFCTQLFFAIVSDICFTHMLPCNFFLHFIINSTCLLCTRFEYRLGKIFTCHVAWVYDRAFSCVFGSHAHHKTIMLLKNKRWDIKDTKIITEHLQDVTRALFLPYVVEFPLRGIGDRIHIMELRTLGIVGNPTKQVRHCHVVVACKQTPHIIG